MKDVIKKLESSRENHLDVIDRVERFLKKKVDFDFYIFYQDGDEFVMGYYDSDDEFSKNASLDRVLQVIEHKGILTLDDYMKLSI